MTKMEIATYVGFANIMIQAAEEQSDTDDQNLMQKISEALCRAQFILMQEAIEEFANLMDTEEQ